MQNIFNSDPGLKGKNDPRQVVNEQDQLDKINHQEEFQSSGDTIDNSGNSFSKNNRHGMKERKPESEEGNTYEDDPKEGENKMPVN